MKAILIMYLNQSMLQLYQTYKNLLQKVWAGLLIQWSITLLIFQSTIPELVAVTSNWQKNETINIQNINDNECFKRCLVRYLHTPDHHPAIIREVGELYGDNLAFKDVKFSVKVRDIHKIERKLSISINVFGYENKKYPVYVSKKIL